MAVSRPGPAVFGSDRRTRRLVWIKARVIKAELAELLDRLVLRWGGVAGRGPGFTHHPVWYPTVEVRLHGDLVSRLHQRWAGGAIDYSHAITTVPAATVGSVLSFEGKALDSPSDNLFAVRAFDDVSGVEEANTDARVRVVIDADGRDVSNRPNAVVGLAARWTIGDACLASWSYDPSGQGGPPARFIVTSACAGITAIPDLLSFPTRQVDFVSGLAGYGCRLDGLTTASAWTIEVYAVGASDAINGPTASASLSKQSGALAAVDGLVAIPSA